MRRTVPSFTVEVRRRPRQATGPREDMLSLATNSRLTAFQEESLRITAATFEAKTSNQPAVDGAASFPKRRILECLVPENPAGGRLQDESSSEGTANRKLRARRRPSERALSRTLEASSDLTSQLAERPSVASDQPAHNSPSDATAVSAGVPTASASATTSRVVGNPGDSPPRPKAKARVQAPIAFDAGEANVSAKDQRLIARTESLGALPTSVDDDARPNRKRTIMGRYVIGDELKPGERWKRRLNKTR